MNTFVNRDRFRNKLQLITLYSTTILMLLSTFFFILALKSPPHAHATDTSPTFSYLIDLNLVYHGGNTYMEVTNSTTINVNDRLFTIPPQTYDVFINNFYNSTSPYFAAENNRIINSLHAQDGNGNSLNFTTEVDNTSGLIIVHVEIPRVITTSSPYVLNLSYQTASLINDVGEITNLYIPGLPADTKFHSSDRVKNGTQDEYSNSYTYQARLHIIDDPRKISYISPQSVSRQTLGKDRILTFNQEDRLGNTGWVQLGTEQFYTFQITQKIDLINNSLLGTGQATVTIPLPRDTIETNQKVYFETFSIDPFRINRDDLGNITAEFEITDPTIKQIEITGYITQSLDSDTLKTPKQLLNIPLNDYYTLLNEQDSFSKYTQEDTFWEINDNLIKQTATSLQQDKDTLWDLIKADYDFVIAKLSYSDEKVNSTNERIGAAAAIRGGDAVCMEYADLLIAIFRAQGIPARAVVGYGNDPTEAENNVRENDLQTQTISHQWVQIWVPGYGWMSMDPTWGDTSGREYIGADLDHVTWFIIGDNDENFAGTLLESAGFFNNDTQVYSVNLTPHKKSEIPLNKLSTMRTPTDLMASFQPSQLDDISHTLRSSPAGGAIIQSLPACGILIAFMIFTVTIQKIFVKKKAA